MPLFRVMTKDADGFPRCGSVAHHLGVRPGTDILVGERGEVLPGSGGLSVGRDPALLPPHLRPKQFPGGRGRLPLFALEAPLPSSLTHRFDAEGTGAHGLVEPSSAMPLVDYQRELCGTRKGWTEA